MKRKLDTTAIVHTALMSDKSINVYRISITLDHTVQPDVLQHAVDNLVQRYPMICCRIVDDGCWVYTEGLESLTVMPDTLGILGSLNCDNVYNQAVNIIFSDDRIIFEAFHSVTDGHGAFTYINALLGEYMRLKSAPDAEFIYHGLPPEAEFEDGFTVFGDSQKKPAKIVDIVNRFTFDKIDHSLPLKFTTYRLNLKEMKMLAKHYQCTLNELLLLMIYNAIFSLKSSDNKDVVLAVPINLRNKFRSQSLRNFTHIAKTVLRKQTGENSTVNMIREIRRQLHLQNNKEHLHDSISKLARIQKSFFMRIAPLWLKKIIIRAGDNMGYDKSCMTVSNLGDLSHMLPAVTENIRYIDIMLSPRRNSPYNCCISSIGEYMNVTFTHNHIKDSFIDGIDKWLMENNISYTTQLHA